MAPFPARGAVRGHVVGGSSGGGQQELDDLGDISELLNMTHFHLSRCPYTELSGIQMDASHYIKLVLFPMLLLQGVVGNLLAMPILSSLARQAWSTIWYLALVAAFDLIILLIDCGNLWYTELTDLSLTGMIQGTSDAMCKTYIFLFAGLKHLIPWILVTVAVEMCIATRWPMLAYNMCSLERARNVLLLLLILVVCLDINHFWTWGVLHKELGCRYSEQFSTSFMEWIWPLINGLVELLLPLLFISVCFFPTATAMIRRTTDEDKRLDTKLKGYFLQLDTLYDFRCICLVICLIFMALTVFKITFNITEFLFYKDYFNLDCAAMDRFTLNLQLLSTFDMTISYLFYSCKIYIYVGMSSAFRAKIQQGFWGTWMRMTHCCRYAKKRWSPVHTADPSDQGFLVCTQVPDVENALSTQNAGHINPKHDERLNNEHTGTKDALGSSSLSTTNNTAPVAQGSRENMDLKEPHPKPVSRHDSGIGSASGNHYDTIKDGPPVPNNTKETPRDEERTPLRSIFI